MSSSQQWAGLSKPQSSRKSTGRHRGQKLPGTPFFQVDPVVSLDRIDHPKPKVVRRRSRKQTSKENRPSDSNTLSVGAEFSTISGSSEGEKLSTDPRTEKTSLTAFGESSLVSYASEDQDTQQFLANAGLERHPNDDTVIGQTITYNSGEDAVVGDAIVADDDFQSGLSLSYSSTLNCKIHEASTSATIVNDGGGGGSMGSSYLQYSSSLCQFSKDSQFVDIPIPETVPVPEKYPALPMESPSPQPTLDSPMVPKSNLMQPLLTSSGSDREESDEQSWTQRTTSRLWSCLFCCFPSRS